MIAITGLLLPLASLGAPHAEVPAGTLASSAPEVIVWNPDPGTRLRREVKTTHYLTAESQNFVNRQGEAVSQRLFEMRSTQRLMVTDHLEKVGEGRPTRLRRRYDDTGFEVNIESSMGKQRTRDQKFKGTGSVADRDVVFTWVPEDEEYGRYYDGRAGIEEVLPGLIEDLGMRSILPDGPVDLGESWKLEPGDLREVLSCGGDVDFELSGGVGFDMLRMMRLGVGLDLDQVFGGQEEGEVTAMLMAVTEEADGGRLAEIFLQFDVVLSRDLKDRAQEGSTMREVRMGLVVDSNVVTMELEGSGVLRWDLASGRLHDTKGLKAKQRVGYKLVQAQETPDGRELFSQELVMVGSLTQEVRVEAIDQ